MLLSGRTDTLAGNDPGDGADGGQVALAGDGPKMALTKERGESLVEKSWMSLFAFIGWVGENN